jgi:hypothetical protein
MMTFRFVFGQHIRLSTSESARSNANGSTAPMVFGLFIALTYHGIDHDNLQRRPWVF